MIGPRYGETELSSIELSSSCCIPFAACYSCIEDLMGRRRLQDVAGGVAGVQEIVEGAKEAVIESVAANVEAQMAADRKTTALKFLQGLIWTEGARPS